MTPGEPIHVLHVIKGLGRGGAERLLEHAERHVDRARFRLSYVYFLERKGALAAVLRDLGAEVTLMGARGALGMALSVGRLARLMRQRRVDLIIPVVKGWCTEMAQESTSLGVQVHGGMGFIEETGAAQHMRDARILTIYEGTTGIQALDLMGRKMLRDQGRAMAELIDEMKTLQASLDGAAGDIGIIGERFGRALLALEQATRYYLEAAAEDPDLGSAVGVDYMMLTGNVVCAWLLAKSALIAQKHVDAGSDDEFFRHKIATARFFAERILPRSEALRAMVESGSASVMAIDADSF